MAKKKKIRNPEWASWQASSYAATRRSIVLKEIIDVVFMRECECGKCRSGDISAICMTATKIADICNAEDIQTLREKTKDWKPNAVTNLVRKEGGEFKAKIEREAKKKEEISVEHALEDHI